MKQFWCFLKLVVDHYVEIDFWSWFLQKTSSKLLRNLQVLWQYSRVLHLQVNIFFKYWLNTRKYYPKTYEYCHNTCEYWAGEYTLSKMVKAFLFTCRSMSTPWLNYAKNVLHSSHYRNPPKDLTIRDRTWDQRLGVLWNDPTERGKNW